jgi:RNA polymerase sigma-70 factor (ECF subfamily)
MRECARDADRPGGSSRKADFMKGSDHFSNREPEAPPSATSATLLERARQGDRQSWQRLMDLYRPLVLWWCRRRTARREDAEDVAQDVFQTVLTNLGKFKERQRKGSFRTWLKRITHYKLLEHRHRADKQPAAAGGSQAQDFLAELPEESGESSSEEDATEGCILVRRALELVRPEFEPKTWQAAWQTAVEGRPGDEVARSLGMTTGAVYIAKSRVLKRLRQELTDLLE